MEQRPAHDEAIERLWRERLTNGYRSKWAFLPGAPRCAICGVPLGGVGARLARLKGYRPSPRDPHSCTVCDEGMPVGGAEVDMAVLFTDIRRAIDLGARLDPRESAELLQRFHAVVSDVLVKRLAFVHQLAGDQVMALFYPASNGPKYRREAVLAAEELLQRVGYIPGHESWLPLRAAAHAGPVFFGKLERNGVSTLTALGDTIDTTARLESVAAAGEILLSDEIYPSVQDLYAGLDRREVRAGDDGETMGVYVLRPLTTPAAPLGTV